MSLSANRCDSVDSSGSIASSSADAGSHRDETVQLQQFGEKMVLRINRMKKQLMDKTVAYLAEQNCRKSAEARLDIELRKVYKLQAHNQEIAHHNAKLQQQLRASKNEVEKLTLENSCLQSTFKVSATEEHGREAKATDPDLEQHVQFLEGMVEGLTEQLGVLNTTQDQLESAPVKPVLPPQAPSESSQRPEAKLRASIVQPLPEHLRESMSDLIQGSAEVFDIVASQTSRQPPIFCCGKDLEPGPSTPEHSDGGCMPARSRHRSPHSRESSRSSLETVLINPITPTQSADFCTDSELCLTLPTPLPTQTSLPRTDSLLSTSSLEQLSTASVTSSPLLNCEEGKTDWLAKLSAHQIVLGSDENPTLLEVHIQKPRDAAASRRNGQEWHEPFRLADDDLPVALPELIVDSAASGEDSASRNPPSLLKEIPSLKKTRSGGIRALYQRSLSQAFGQGKTE